MHGPKSKLSKLSEYLELLGLYFNDLHSVVPNVCKKPNLIKISYYRKMAGISTNLLKQNDDVLDLTFFLPFGI